MSSAPYRPNFQPGRPPTFRASPQQKNNGRIFAIIALVALAMATTVGAFLGAFLQLGTDGCGPDACHEGLIAASFFVSAVGPVVVFGGALVVTLVMIVQKVRAAFVVPLVALVVDVACLVGGFYLMHLGAGI